MKKRGCITCGAATTHAVWSSIKDRELDDAAQSLERREDLAPWQTRPMIRELINVRYTLPE